MNLLLDTHVILWLLDDYKRLSVKANKLLRDESQTLYTSVASAWEIAIKVANGKLELDGGVKSVFDNILNSAINIITIEPKHIELVESLPFIHRDPFDRIIIATAISEDMTIISSDENIHKYDVRCVW